MFKALKSFCGKVSMKKGETKDINDKEIIKDLLNAGYIAEVKEEVKKIEEKVEEKAKKPKTSKNKK